MLERVVIQDLQDHECHEEKCVELVLRSVDGVIELQHASIDPVEVELYSIRTQIVLQRYRLLAVNLPNFPTHGACLGASMFSEPLRNAPFMNVLAALGFAEGKVACFLHRDLRGILHIRLRPSSDLSGDVLWSTSSWRI
jgi:hypothetical protein